MAFAGGVPCLPVTTDRIWATPAKRREVFSATWWLLSAVLQIFVIVAGTRIEWHAGLWSWSKFVFALSFGLLEGVIVIVPMI